jgi:hypothetical protein
MVGLIALISHKFAPDQTVTPQVWREPEGMGSK